MRLQHTNLTHLMPFLIIRTHFEHGMSLMWAGSFGATYQKWLRKRVLVVRPLHLRFGVCFIPLNGDHVTRRLHQVILVFHGMNWPFTLRFCRTFSAYLDLIEHRKIAFAV